ncbi:hypothetical protein MRB53_032516 [Persea americana]|uniref:Uncharacterized protein n=1 Tax=Persea americana TaxID=3435 RepID=A0ACC2KS44_PERAE|nr:hypothetical protein MRB53_032516 [Persea americana]
MTETNQKSGLCCNICDPVIDIYFSLFNNLSFLLTHVNSVILHLMLLPWPDWTDRRISIFFNSSFLISRFV